MTHNDRKRMLAELAENGNFTDLLADAWSICYGRDGFRIMHTLTPERILTLREVARNLEQAPPYIKDTGYVSLDIDTGVEEDGIKITCTITLA